MSVSQTGMAAEIIKNDPEVARRIIRHALSPGTATREEQDAIRKKARGDGDKPAEQRLNAAILLEKKSQKDTHILTALKDLAADPEKTGIKDVSQAINSAVENGLLSSKGPLARAGRSFSETGKEELGELKLGPKPNDVRSFRVKAALEGADKIADPTLRAMKLNQVALIAEATGDKSASEGVAMAAIAITQEQIEEQRRRQRAPKADRER